MLVTNRMLELSRFASKDETRYNLNGIYIDQNGRTVATDGHVLAVAEFPPPFEESDYPRRDGEAPMAALDAPAFLPTADCERIRKAAPGKRTFPRTMAGVVRIDGAATNANGHVEVETWDGDSVSTLRVKKQEVELPSWRTVMPDAKGEPAVILSASLLKRVAELAEKLSDSRACAVQIRLNGERGPVRFDVVLAEGHATLLCMPMTAAAHTPKNWRDE